MSDVTVWHNARCSKSRGACALLEERNIATHVVRYLDEPPARADIERVMALLGIEDPREMMRTGEPRYRELGLRDADADTLIDAMAANPILIERPIVIRGDRAVIARPPERALELFG